MTTSTPKTKKPRVIKADSTNLEAKVFNQAGKADGSLALEPQLFGLKWNADLVHQVVFSMMSNARTVVAHTKGRTEVSGGGKKPWQQKGTGRARHGSSRSPIWKGGGVTHGPSKDVNFTKKINKKMKTKALFTLLSRKNKESEVLFMSDLKLAGKTKLAGQFLTQWSAVPGFDKINYARGRRLLVVTPSKDLATEQAFANLKAVQVTEARNLNPLDLVTYKYILLAEPAKVQSTLLTRMAMAK
jgi:large subunit ribosomal protein L4